MGGRDGGIGHFGKDEGDTHTDTYQAPTHMALRDKGRVMGRDGGGANGHTQRTNGRSAGSRQGSLTWYY